MDTQLLLTFLSLVIIFLWHWLLRNKHSPIYQWPFLGMLPGLLLSIYNSTLHDFCTRALRRARGTFLFKGPSFINADFTVTSDPANINHIFNKNAANYDKGRDFNAIMEFMGDGIFNVDGESWKFQRKLLHSLLHNPEFEGHAMETLERKMLSTLLPVLDRAADEALDIQDVFKRFMFDNMCLLVFGFDPQYLLPVGSKGASLLDCACGNAFDELWEVVIYRFGVPMCVWRLQRRLKIGMEWKFIQAWTTLDQLLYGSIIRKRQELATKNSVENDEHKRNKLDLLTQILVMKDEDDGGDQKIIDKTSDKFLRDTAFTLIAAGRDTVAASLTWLIWCVANHPVIEKRIIEELKQVMAVRLSSAIDDGQESGGFLRNDELNKLVYLQATICETLRLYPPVPFEQKSALEADVLPSGHTVRKEERIIFSIYAMARMEEIWGEDCLEFKPERWIYDKGTILHVPSYKFMTFLTGARTCLGKNMSFTQIKSLASALFWNYKFELINVDPSVKPAVGMVLFMKDGLKTRVSKRDH